MSRWGKVALLTSVNDILLVLVLVVASAEDNLSKKCSLVILVEGGI